MLADATILNAVLTPFVGAAAIAGTVIGVFWKFEDTASPELKQMVVRWLRYRGTGASDAWANQLVVIFNNVLGKHHFSWKCIGRSCLASILAVCFMAVILATHLGRSDFVEFILSFSDPTLAASFVFIALILNCVPDYFSYMKTRVILGFMSNAHRLGYVFLFALTDTLATVALFVVAMALFLPFSAPDIFHSFMDALIKELKGAPGFLKLTITTTGANPLERLGPGVFFFASLFVSIWAWIYAIAAFIGRFLVSALPRVMPKIVWFFDVDNHPIRSLGCIAGIIVFCGALALNEIR